jgi:BON domain/YMGG-like Gly-zipper
MNEIRSRPGRAASAAILLALFAMAAAVGCAKKPDDAAITRDIQSRFYADTSLKTTSIQVAVNQGRVTLAGEVPAAELKDRAVQIAQRTPGVSDVDDRITVAAPAALAAPAPAAAPPAPARAKRAAASRAKPKPAAPSGVAKAQGITPAGSAAPPAPVRPVRITIPTGTHLSVRMIDSVDSSRDQAGQVFRASLDAPILVDGEEAVPAGADVFVRLATAKSAGRMLGSSELELQLVKMQTGGRTYPLVSNSYTAKGKSRGTETAERVGVGAAVGAVVGAIAGGKKGAAIGAAAGAGTGAAVQLATRGQQVKVPSETLLDFQLQQPVTVTKTPAKK